MSALSTRPPEPPGASHPPGPPEDDYSPAFAAWALLLTVAVLVSLVIALWALRGL